jgi:hypothetical protein
MSVSVRGVVGEITYAYFSAATLRDYVVTRRGRAGWTLRAAIAKRDAFNLTRRPLMFVAPHINQKTGARGEWRWPVLDLAVTNTTITATLGEPVR